MPFVQPQSHVLQLHKAHMTKMPGSTRSTTAPICGPLQTRPEIETGAKAVAPAAPPSILQLQIKAIITEQAQTQNQKDNSSSEAPAEK